MVRAPVTLSRVGVFNYRQPDGTVRRELRPPEEVFSADSIASFELVPFTDDHPWADGGVVDASNAQRLQIGAVGGVHKNGDLLDAKVMISVDSAVGKLLLGRNQVSCGYHCDREFTPGTWVDSAGASHPYDAIQRNIRGNHVALVKIGRAGPEARIRLDSDDAINTDGEALEDQKNMLKITIDGVPVEVSEQSAALVQKALADREAKLAVADAQVAKITADSAASKAQADKAQAVCDSLTAEVKALKDPSKFEAAVAERVGFEAKARTHLGAEFAFAGKSDRDVKVAVISKLSPALSCDSKSDEYVNALYDHLASAPAKGNPATDKVREEMKNATKATVDAADGDIDPRKAMEKAFFSGK